MHFSGQSCINTFYLTDSYIVFTLKIESVSKNYLKMMVKKGLEKIFLKFLHAEAIFFLFILLTNFEENHKFSNKNNHLPAWRKITIFSICTWPHSPVRAKILSRFQFEGKNAVWISQVRHVKWWLRGNVIWSESAWSVD